MMFNDEQDQQKSKMESLMEIVKLMKQLQSEHGHPKAIALDIHAEKELPGQPEESPEHEASESAEEETAEHAPEGSEAEESAESPEEESSETPEHEMELPEAFKKLLAERLKR